MHCVCNDFEYWQIVSNCVVWIIVQGFGSWECLMTHWGTEHWSTISIVEIICLLPCNLYLSGGKMVQDDWKMSMLKEYFDVGSQKIAVTYRPLNGPRWNFKFHFKLRLTKYEQQWRMQQEWMWTCFLWMQERRTEERLKEIVPPLFSLRYFIINRTAWKVITSWNLRFCKINRFHSKVSPTTDL